MTLFRSVTKSREHSEFLKMVGGSSSNVNTPLSCLSNVNTPLELFVKC